MFGQPALTISRERPLGQRFQVTSFTNPSLMMPPTDPSLLQISVAEDRLVLPLAAISGTVWMLENVGNSRFRVVRIPRYRADRATPLFHRSLAVVLREDLALIAESQLAVVLT